MKKIQKIVWLIIAVLIVGAVLAAWMIPREEAPPALAVSVPEREVVLVASSADYNNASEFVGYIENKGGDVIHVGADNFLENYSNRDFVILLGGPNSGENIWELLKEALTENEENYILAPDHAMVYVKEDVWSTGQTVIIYAGENSDLIQQIQFNSITPPTLTPPNPRPATMTERKTSENSPIPIVGLIRHYSGATPEEEGYWFLYEKLADPIVDVIVDAMKDSVTQKEYTFHIPGYPVSWKVDVHFFFDLWDFIDFVGQVASTASTIYDTAVSFSDTFSAVDENGGIHPVSGSGTISVPSEVEGNYYEKSNYYWDSSAHGFVPTTFTWDQEEAIKHEEMVMYASSDYNDWENLQKVFTYEILSRLSMRNEVGGVLSESVQVYYPFGYFLYYVPEQTIQVGNQHYYLDYISVDNVSLGDEWSISLNMYAPHDVVFHYKGYASATEGDNYQLVLKSDPPFCINLITPPGPVLPYPQGTFPKGHNVTISLDPVAYFVFSPPSVEEYYTFEKWVVDGTDYGKSQPITLTMDMDHTVIAKFSHMPKPSATISPSYFMITGENSITFTATVFLGDSPALGSEMSWWQSGWTGTFTEKDNTTDNLGMCTATWVAPSVSETKEGIIGAFVFPPYGGLVEVESLGIVYPAELGATPSFSVSALPSSLTIGLGDSGSYTVAVTSLHGFSLPVDLSVTGLPGGIISTSPGTATPPPNGTWNSTFVIGVLENATVGTYTLTITGTSGSTVHSTTVVLIISLASPELIAYTPDPTTDNTPNLDWNPVTGAAKYTLQYAADNAFTQNLTTVENITDDNYLIPSPGLTSDMWYWRVKAIDGVGNESVYSSHDSFTVAIEPDFSILASPSSLSAQATYENSYTIRVTSLNGFNSAVTLSVAGLPEACTSIFSTNPVTPPANDSVSPTLTVGPSATTPQGTYTLTITGTSGSLVHSTNVELVVYY